MAKGKDRLNIYEILKSSASSKVTSPVEPEVSRPVGSVEDSSIAKDVPQPITLKSPSKIGENTIKITYNTAIFLLIIFFGFLLIAYVWGVKNGKSKFLERQTAPIEERKPNPPKENMRTHPTPPGPTILRTIRVAKYPFTTEREKEIARKNADAVKKLLGDAGLTGAKTVYEQSGRITVQYGEFKDQYSSEAKATFDRIDKIGKERGRGYNISPEFIVLTR